MTSSIEMLTAHYEGIAEYFSDPYTVVEKTGEETVKNGLGFPQMIALGAIPQQLTWNLINKLAPMEQEAREKCITLQRNNSGTEIAKRNLAIALDAYDRIAEKIQLQEAAVEAAKAVYARHVGRAWTYFEPGARAMQDVKTSDVEDRFAARFGKVNPAGSRNTERDLANERTENSEDTRETVEMERLPEQHGRPRKARK
jgi:hypothetical protein